MRVSHCIGCTALSCPDVCHEGYMVPSVDIHPGKVSIFLISEAASASPRDYYYARGNPLFAETTVLAFRDAGLNVRSMRDILALGVYLTTAVKCSKDGYAISTATVQECSLLLEEEIALFPDVKAFLLMGDVAIKAVNSIARRSGQARVIPAGSTYKLRGKEYFFRGKRAFPSYLQAGPSFFIEKSKRKMIAQDISQALALI